MDKPSIGSEKKGDLRGVYVHRGTGSHFKFHANQNAKRTWFEGYIHKMSFHTPVLVGRSFLSICHLKISCQFKIQFWI